MILGRTVLGLLITCNRPRARAFVLQGKEQIGSRDSRVHVAGDRQTRPSEKRASRELRQSRGNLGREAEPSSDTWCLRSPSSQMVCLGGWKVCSLQRGLAWPSAVARKVIVSGIRVARTHPVKVTENSKSRSISVRSALLQRHWIVGTVSAVPFDRRPQTFSHHPSQVYNT